MAAKPRKSVVQNIIKNLLESEIPEIQNASKELAEWTIELTDLIKDLEATLNDMRHTGALPPPPAAALPAPAAPAIEEPAVTVTEDRMLRGYGRSGRVLRPRELPRAELRGEDGRIPVKRIEQAAKDEKEVEGPARTPQGVLIAKDSGKPGAKAELPAGGKEVAVRREGKEPAEEEPGKSSYVTPEGFRVRRMR
jgi:hypothetical protein